MYRKSLAPLLRALALCAGLWCAVSAPAQVDQKWTWTDASVGTRDERCRDVAVDAAGNTYIAGWNEVAGAGDLKAMVTKLDPNGNVLWSRNWDDGNTATQDIANGVAVTPTGEVYAVGMLHNDFYTIKYDGLGNTLWSRSYHVDNVDFNVPFDLAIDSNGGIAACGRYQISGTTNRRWVVIRYDTNGNLIWEKEPHSLTADKVAFDGSGNLLVLGTNGDGVDVGFTPMGLMKYDPAGDVLFDIKFAGGTNFLVLDAGGNVYVPFHGSNGDGVSKIDPNGNIAYQTALDPDPTKSFSSIGGAAIDPAGNLVAGGLLQLTSDDFTTETYNFGTWKFNHVGTLIWLKSWEFPVQPTPSVPAPIGRGAHGILVDAAGNIYANGVYFDGVVDNLYFEKFNADGVTMWPESGGLFVNHAIVAPGIVAFGFGRDATGNLYVGGATTEPQNSPSAFRAMKFSDSFVSGLSLSPTTISGNAQSTATVTMQGPAPSGGFTLTLTAASGAGVPAKVVVPGGATTTTFQVSDTNATYGILHPAITAKCAGSSFGAILNVYPANGGTFVSQTMPTTMSTGQSMSVSVLYKNTGLTTWDNGHGYKLVSRNPANNTIWGTSHLLLTGATAPGGTGTFAVTITAPSTPGVYNFQWLPIEDALGAGFGQISPNVAVTVSVAITDAAQFISQKPFGEVTPGAVFSANVTMKNTGTSTWTQAAGYCALSQDPSNNKIWGTNRLLVPGSASVTPGSQVICSNTLTTPVTPGTYPMQWRMYHNGFLFGDLTPVQMVVVGQPSDAQYISEVVPTSVVVGTTFTMKVTMQNTGDTTWKQATGYCLLSINPVNNKTWGTNRLLIPSTATIAPGGQVTLFNTVTAPLSPGTYTMQWQMSDGATLFGQQTPSVQIVVTAS